MTDIPKDQVNEILTNQLVHEAQETWGLLYDSGSSAEVAMAGALASVLPELTDRIDAVVNHPEEP